ncbi:MAG: DUF1553 domain-containing protein, partial [Pirellulales bacterium]
ARESDPENRLLWRMTTRRLDAEQIRDAMLAVSGELDYQAGGAGTDINSSRRTIYTKVIRNKRPELLHLFDAPDNFNSTANRNVTTTPIQSLLMINGPWTLARARAMSKRLTSQKRSAAETVDAAYQIAFCRDANEEEREASRNFLTAKTEERVDQNALLDFCHALLNSNEFLYID